MKKLTLATLAALAVPALGVSYGATAQTQAQIAAVCPKGDVTRVRLSKIKPGATMAQYEEAVAAHKAWYKAKGYKLVLTQAPVLVWKDGAPSVAPDQIMSFASGDSVPRDKQDAGWAEFVAKYRAASELAVEQVVCMPKHG
ncbi:hypothetical protein ACLBKU_16840 [Erythrobacter sp. NE805]|uniref:hypothetical protein n=1 Tax=Erythrobacter sp. NE805 TaxID=3389875 RepID=UPI00396AF33C